MKLYLPDIFNYLSLSQVKSSELVLKCIRNRIDFCEEDDNYKLAFIGNPFIKSDNPLNSKIINLPYCIKKYKKGIKELANSLDGSFLLIFVDLKLGMINIVNDRFGVYPFFYFISDDGFIGSIHSDEVGTKIKDQSLDLISLGEFVRVGTITPGYSFYKNIKSLDYGTILTFDINKKIYSKLKYFDPSLIASKPYKTLNEAYKSMFNSINFLKKRYTNIFKDIGLLLSGGTDSRLIAIFFKNKCRAFSLSSFNNRSKRITQKIASSLRINLDFVNLEYNQYIKDLDFSIYLSGGISSFIENHYSNTKFINIISKKDLLISGCYFDYVFKGLTTNTRSLEIFGLKIPFLIKAPIQLYFYKKDFNVEKKLQELIDKRRSIRFKNINDKNLLEFERVAPLYLECENIGRRSLILFTNWSAFVANYNFIEVMLRTPIDFKINTKLIRLLIFRNSGSIKFVPNSNTGVPIYPSVFLDIIHRILNKIIKNITLLFYSKLRNTKLHGSWVFSKEYVKQKEFEEIFMSIQPEERKIISSILGNDIWKNNEFKKIINDYNQNFIVRIITISKWLEMKRNSLLFKGL